MKLILLCVCSFFTEAIFASYWGGDWDKYLIWSIYAFMATIGFIVLCFYLIFTSKSYEQKNNRITFLISLFLLILTGVFISYMIFGDIVIEVLFFFPILIFNILGELLRIAWEQVVS